MTSAEAARCASRLVAGHVRTQTQAFGNGIHERTDRHVFSSAAPATPYIVSSQHDTAVSSQCIIGLEHRHEHDWNAPTLHHVYTRRTLCVCMALVWWATFIQILSAVLRQSVTLQAQTFLSVGPIKPCNMYSIIGHPTIHKGTACEAGIQISSDQPHAAGAAFVQP